MWDYDKLFAEGNIIGVKYGVNSSIEKYIVPPKDSISYYSINFNSFCNRELKSGLCQIQYIIQLDEHENAIKKLFDRERDMPVPIPKLETGMFGKVLYCNKFEEEVDFSKEETFGKFVIIKDKIIYCSGGYDFLEEILINSKNFSEGPRIVEIYKDAVSFKDCNSILWRDSEYQNYISLI